ncbi:MAG TPA: ABC transporter permease subunit [Acidimicrobiales bacterium]|nr:ABC transporter permease subunit [Acidimicrobiales bacterium]
MPREARHAVLWMAGRRTLRAGVVWGLGFGVLVATTAAGYAGAFPTLESRQKLATSFSSNPGIAALIGPARRLDTVAGFTAWRTIGIVSIVGAVWGLFWGTRALRGEEDAGRWELVLAGPTTRGRATGETLTALLLGWVALLVVTIVCVVASSRSTAISFDAGNAVLLCCAITATALLFMAIGAAAAQLASTRRQANAIGGGVLGASYLVRMVADADSRLSWLRWASPLGWIEELRPFAGARPIVLVLIAAVAVALGVVAIRLADARDCGSGSLRVADSRALDRRGLQSPFGLSLRLLRPTMVAWFASLSVAGVIFGLVAQSAAEGISGNTVVEDSIARIGGRRGGAQAYLGLTLVIAAALIAFVVASHISALRAEEDEGHLDTLFAQPVSRTRWLVGRAVIAAGVAVLAGVTTGVGAWLGAASQHTRLDFATLVAAGLNLAPPALFVVGVGVLVHGFHPRWAPTVAYTLVAWSFVIELVASVINANHWLLDTSLLYHLAPAPATDPRWSSAAALVGLGVAAAVVGVVRFEHRDL